MKKSARVLLIILAFAGTLDAGYLTYEHYANIIPPCSTSFFSDCGKVLSSTYSVIFGIPLALIGLVHYLLESVTLFFAGFHKNQTARCLALFLTTIGFISSFYFVYLQLFVIGAICLYCMASAAISTAIFAIALFVFSGERTFFVVWITKYFYRSILKPLFFLHDPELMHTVMTSFGELLGQFRFTRWLTSFGFYFEDSHLVQTIAGICFKNPIGLAAGFDYEARITQITPSISFGFQSVGTITNNAYEGNPRPMLGRLPKSKSLMVNKGFKNLGAKNTAQKLEKFSFSIPIGISVGKTNTLSLKTQRQSIRDIAKAFTIFERSSVTHSYYELNISCPNLKGNITFYPPNNLDQLLSVVDQLRLSRPVFVKMPIEKSNSEFLKMLSVIARHSPVGVIIGNLQKNRNDPSLRSDEVAKFPVGNFSGKPCFERSNHLISLTYKKYKKRFVIVGCGGVFNAKDAYEKIKRGASLVQLITGMIYEGPQLIADIHIGLVELLKRDRYENISEAIGTR